MPKFKFLFKINIVDRTPNIEEEVLIDVYESDTKEDIEYRVQEEFSMWVENQIDTSYSLVSKEN